jgi:class 3 adenylate cyclase/tetratricopeptide (TPR) repeat protein
MVVCSSCGAELREGARFCDSCGATQATPAEAHEQRKTVTVVFCDVTGSTALGERLDAESFRRVMARYFDEARRVIERHGGTVEKFIGDAVMAVFGVPVVHEDDAIRAVRAAAELRSAIEVLNAELNRDYDTTLELRIGINTGEVVTGTEERLATGDAVNVAARLQQAAAPGEILLGRETCALARDAVVVEELAPIELKGKQAPIVAYRLEALTPDAPGVARHLDAPMVGRTHERHVLDDAFANAARKRACALFTLLGAAGVGKSRLAREFLSGVDARVVQGQCLSYGEGITYWPVVEVLKQLGGSAGQPALEALLGEAETPTTPEEIAWALRKVLEAKAQEKPLVVLFDDVHWGEPTFLDLIEHIADLSRDAPILLLCLARPELLDLRPGWGGGKLNATTILLDPLDAGETDELIERLLGGEELDAGLVSRIRTAADGNPLFVEEMLAMVRASGEREVVVPPTIKALLAARLDQLDPVERNVLERGSVEGQLFHSAAVEAIARVPASVERQLVALVRKELVRPDHAQMPVGDAYRFRHILIRDAAYDALPKAVRAELHERFADWLDVRGTDVVEHDEIVAYHLEQAYRYRAELGPVDSNGEALATRASSLLHAAARTARLRGDLRAAAALLARAADLAGEGRLELLPELADLLFETTELARAGEILSEAIATATTRGNAGVLAMASLQASVIAVHTEAGESFERTLELADDAAAIFERRGDDRSLAAVLVIAGRHRFYLGRAREAEPVLQRAFECAMRADDIPRAQESLVFLAIGKGWGPTPFGEALAFLDEIPQEHRSASLQAWVHLLHGWYAGYQGRFEEARLDFAKAKEMVAEIGLIAQVGALPIAIGIIELEGGRPDVAEEELRAAYGRLGELGETGFRSTVATLLAQALVDLDRDREADGILDAALVLAQADDVDPQVRARTVQAQLFLRRGELAEAERIAREALAIASKTDYLLAQADALFAIAGVQIASGDPGAAATALTGALELYERKEASAPAARVRALLSAGASSS